MSPQSSPAGQALTVVPCFADLGQEEELSPRSESKIHLERTRSNTTSHIPAKGTTSFILTQPNELLYPIDQYYTHTHTHPLNKKHLTSTPPMMLSLPTSPPLAVTRSLLQLQQSQINLATRERQITKGWIVNTHSSTFSSSLWSTVNSETAPPWVSKMQRESPTDATVTVHLSTTTNVTVVPEVSPEGNDNEKRKP